MGRSGHGRGRHGQVRRRPRRKRTPVVFDSFEFQINNTRKTRNEMGISSQVHHSVEFVAVRDAALDVEHEYDEVNDSLPDPL